MRTVLRIFFESVAQAVQQLTGNKLRSFLSLLGITIGIFCIIGVLSAVDSLEDNVRGSLEKLGNDVMYVAKFPWADMQGQWWKIMQRPNPDHSDYEVLQERSRLAGMVAYYVVVGFRTLKYKSNSVENAALIGVTQEFSEMFKLEFDRGRFFSPSENRYGTNVVVLGYETSQELFGAIDPIGKTIKVQGRNYEVIGVIEKAGDDVINVLDFDNTLLVSYSNARSLANLKARYVFNGTVTVKAKPGVDLLNLRYEIQGLLRSHRRLKPREEDNFSINELSMITSVFDSIFSVLNILGIIIGLFALLVGGFSVANIMFVSVKERTGIIGVKKALGAKSYVILLEFLIESVILCLIGGATGLLLVHVVTTVLSGIIDFSLYLDFGNIVVGVIVSVLIGVVSGLIPAIQGARMDPVEAMRK